MLEFGIATLILIVTILVGFPIAYSIGLTTIFYIFITNPANLLVIPIRMFSGINSFTLMALPLFMLAAEIMVRTGISSKLFDFVRITRVGKWRGGLAYVNVLASTIFGSISGAALSDIAGLGKVEIDAMEEDGYEKGFACAITAASSIESPPHPAQQRGHPLRRHHGPVRGRRTVRRVPPRPAAGGLPNALHQAQRQAAQPAQA